MVRNNKTAKHKANKKIEVQQLDKPYTELRAPQQFSQNLLAGAVGCQDSIREYANTGVPDHLTDDLEMLPGLKYQASMNSPCSAAWLGSQSSRSSNNHSFEMDLNAQADLLKAPRVWERRGVEAKSQKEPINSVFPQFVQHEEAFTTQAGGMTRADAGDRAGSMQQNSYTQREGRNPEEAFNSTKNFNLTQKDSYSSVKSQDNLQSAKSESHASNDSSDDCLDQDEDDDEDGDLISFSCTPLTLTDAMAFDTYLQNGSIRNMPVFGFSPNAVNTQPVDVPPICSMLQYMGQAISNIKRERSNSQSSDDECVSFQEKKNFEFFFKPRVIENHLDLAIKGDMHFQDTTQLCFEQVQPAAAWRAFDDCKMDIDYDVIPDGDDLINSLMT